MSLAAERPYLWADSDRAPFAIGGTLGLVHGMSPRQVLTALAPDAVTPIASIKRVESRALGDGNQMIEARPLKDGWTLVFNVFGLRPTEHTALRQLSRRGEAVMIYEDAKDNESFQYAKGGRILREFDPMLYDRPWIGNPTAEEKALRFGDERDWHSMTKSVLLAARLTGVELSLADVNSQTGRIAVGVPD